MARLSRVELFDPSEIAVIHAICSVVRNCFLMGDDPLTGKNFDHRKQWIEVALKRSAAYFGIDLIAYALMSTHMHLVLRSRPDMVASWDDTEVARRWLMLCPVRKNKDGSPKEPREAELNRIRNNPDRLREIRSRLSDISWWIRLMCQRFAQRVNIEEQKRGNFWQTRYRAVRLLDEAAILACAAYVDLNPIRAAIAENIESSQFTSAQKRAIALQQQSLDDDQCEDSAEGTCEDMELCDSFLAPVQVDEMMPDLPCAATTVVSDEGKTEPSPVGTNARASLKRCSNKGFANLSAPDYLELLDWTARQIVPGKRGCTPAAAPPLFERLGISKEAWCELVHHFEDYFFIVAGKPQSIDAHRSRLKKHRFRLRKSAREMMACD